MRAAFFLFTAGCVFFVSTPASMSIGPLSLYAAIEARSDSAERSPSWYNLHFQQTVIHQLHPAFRAAYTGANSLPSEFEGKTSLTATLFFGMRLWQGAELYINPEMSGGSGLGGGTGMAGFPNGEAFRIGSPAPVIYPARLYLKQVFLLREREEAEQTYPITRTSRAELFPAIEDAPNQLAGIELVPRLTVIAGKFGVADFYDNDSYAHDPRTQFMNWSLMSAGAWDYPADTRGYTWGVAAELALHNVDIRAMATMMPTTANGLEMDTQIFKGAIGTAVEGEYRYKLRHELDTLHGDLQGIVRGLVFYNLANAGTFRMAIAQAAGTGVAPDITATRRYGTAKYGGIVSVEQAITPSIGAFMRASWSDGQAETWAFTQIDHSFALGAQFDGALWQRNDDVVGVAAVTNGISEAHRAYLAAGGLGFIIGDGALNYGMEFITEAYYRWQVNAWLQLSADYQFVLNPAYNQDRGPVHIFAVRSHVEL
jgi:high affinity Mn2+ porin